MTKDILEQYLSTKAEVERIEKRIDRLEKQSEIVADTIQNGLQGKKKRISVVRGYDKKRARLLKEYNIQLENFRLKLLQEQLEVEKFIEGITKSELRNIFEYRYFEGMNWIQVSFKMNEIFSCEKYTEDSVRKKHDRFLKKL